MGFNPEIKAKINLRAKRIEEERSKKTAREERAIARHEVRKANIRQELADLNQQLAGDPQLRRDLSEVLRAKVDYQTYREVDQAGLCFGLQISRSSDQIALMTEEGIQVLESHSLVRYGRATGHYHVQRFTQLKLEEANVDGLFPNGRFEAGQLADNIADIILKSPNKK